MNIPGEIDTKYILSLIVWLFSNERYPYMIHLCPEVSNTPLTNQNKIITIVRNYRDEEARPFDKHLEDIENYLDEAGINYTAWRFGGSCRFFLYNKKDTVLFKLAFG